MVELTKEEILDIVYGLDRVIGENFHDCIWDVLNERDEEVGEISDEDIFKIKRELCKLLAV
jgi:hypothetical protein